MNKTFKTALAVFLMVTAICMLHHIGCDLCH